ncbi:MAG: TolC family protein [Bacteroidota bacterium]|nr:TolC family protein [Bacteroidota bacterium]
MRIIYKLVGVLMVLSVCSVNAQDFGLADNNEDDFFIIPPLQMLIDSALQYSPLLKTKDIEVTIRQMERRAAVWAWADYIEPFSEFRYGTVDNVVFSQSGLPLDMNQTQASRFNVGARIRLSIFDAITFGNELKIANMRIELDAARRKEIEQLISQEVIRLWNMLKTYRTIFILKSELVVTQDNNLKDAELRYNSGEVPIVELARITEIASKAREGLELTKKELREALHLLIDLVGNGDITTWEVN